MINYYDENNDGRIDKVICIYDNAGNLKRKRVVYK